jgi:hypothetical protein
MEQMRNWGDVLVCSLRYVVLIVSIYASHSFLTWGCSQTLNRISCRLPQIAELYVKPNLPEGQSEIEFLSHSL